MTEPTFHTVIHEFSSGRAGWNGTGLQSDADPGARGWGCGLPLCDSRGDDGLVRQVSSSGVGWQPTVYDAYHHVMRVRAAAVGGLIGRVAPHRQCCAVDAGFRPTTRPGGVRKMGARSAFDPWARMPITTARNGTSIAHAATRCMRVCTIFQRLRTKTTEAPSPSQRSADAVLVVKANTLVILQYVSRLHGPQLFMKAGPGRRLTHNIARRCCTVLCSARRRDNDNRSCRGRSCCMP